MSQASDPTTPIVGPAQPKLLVIGYGNTLRRDDGIGPRLVERLGAQNWPGVEFLTCHQLVPELAERISRTPAVIFADAICGTGKAVALEEVKRADVSSVFVHAADPRSLLAMSAELFGRSPRAWILNIPVEDLSFGDGLSAKAEANLEQAMEVVLEAMHGLGIAQGS